MPHPTLLIYKQLTEMSIATESKLGEKPKQKIKENVKERQTVVNDGVPTHIIYRPIEQKTRILYT